MFKNVNPRSFRNALFRLRKIHRGDSHADEDCSPSHSWTTDKPNDADETDDVSGDNENFPELQQSIRDFDQSGFDLPMDATIQHLHYYKGC